MAEKRMFTKKITESDAFLDMPMSAQCLYFHLNMAADDEGFVNNPKKIVRSIGASNDDFNILIAKSFVITFESGVIVIKHWHMHNYLRSDRFKPTDYIEEKSMLGMKKDKSYTLDEKKMVYQMPTKSLPMVSIDKNSIDKNSIDNNLYANFKPSKKKKSSFNDMITTDYDFDKLEKMVNETERVVN